MYIWEARFLVFFSRSRVLFTRPINIFFNKNNFKTGSYGIIHTFKNYFVTIFLIINGIQTDFIHCNVNYNIYKIILKEK